MPAGAAGWDDVPMLFPLDALPLESAGATPAWLWILLALAAAMVVFFIIVQLLRIIRRRPQDPQDPQGPRQDGS